MCFEATLQGQEIETTVFSVPVVAVELGDRRGQRAADHIAAGPGRVARGQKCRHLGLMAGLHLGRTLLGRLAIGAAFFPALSVQMQQNRGDIIVGGHLGRPGARGTCMRLRGVRW